VGDTIATVIQRPDEITEFLALYWADSKTPAGKRKMLSKQVRLGLARAFRKFDAYQLAKYNRDNPIKLRDALFMVHGKPHSGRSGYNRDTRKHMPVLRSELTDSERLYLDLVDGTLPTPDTWETKLSAGMDKGATFESLLREKKLGYMALLRNLRNMEQAGVDTGLICTALEEGATKSKALPFRYIAAYRNVVSPSIKASLNTAMLTAITGLDGLKGKTMILVDISGSMDAKLSGKSDLTRVDAAAALAVYLRGICESSSVVTFSNDIKAVGPTQGIPLVEEILRSQQHGGTRLGKAIQDVASSGYDRIVVITDEQSADAVGDPNFGSRAYMINVAPYQNGVAYRMGWTKIDGFSEQVVNFIQALEMNNA
jgi:60 kDa SS-A/Ro ribonucleoprotein